MSPYGWGVFFVILGGYLIGRDLGIIPDIPFWGMVFVLLGVYLLAHRNKKH